MVELSADGIITDVNTNALTIFGVPKSAFMGQHMAAFTGEEVSKKALASLNAGKIYENIASIEVGGRSRTLIQRFIPIQDRNGTLLRITLLIFTDDTAEINKQMEEFKEQSYWYESLLNSFNTPISVTDMNGVVTFLNKTALDMLGMTLEQAVGKTCADCWKIENCHTDKCGYKLLEKGVDSSYFKVGDQRFMSQASYLKDSKGRNIGHIEVISNITERENKRIELQELLKKSQEAQSRIAQSEEELRQNMEDMRSTQVSRDEFAKKAHWYEAILDSYELPVSVTDMNKNITFLNRSALTLLGTTEEKAAGRNCGEVWGVEICKDERCGIEYMKCGKGKSVFNVGDQTFTTQASYLKDRSGKAIGHIEIVDNITEHTAHKQETEYQIAKMKMVMDASKIGLWDMHVVKGDPVNPNNVFQWSDEFRRMLGYTDEKDFPNLLNSWSDKLHPEDQQKTLDAFAAHLLDRTGKTPYDLEYRLLKKNGEYSWFHAFGATVRDSEGYALRVAGALKAINK
jgi:PAS domain S-box-containing protein